MFKYADPAIGRQSGPGRGHGIRKDRDRRDHRGAVRLSAEDGLISSSPVVAPDVQGRSAAKIPKVGTIPYLRGSATTQIRIEVCPVISPPMLARVGADAEVGMSVCRADARAWRRTPVSDRLPACAEATPIRRQLLTRWRRSLCRFASGLTDQGLGLIYCYLANHEIQFYQLERHQFSIVWQSVAVGERSFSGNGYIDLKKRINYKCLDSFQTESGEVGPGDPDTKSTTKRIASRDSICRPKRSDSPAKRRPYGGKPPVM